MKSIVTLSRFALVIAAAGLVFTLASCKSTCSSCQKGAAAQNSGYRY